MKRLFSSIIIAILFSTSVVAEVDEAKYKEAVELWKKRKYEASLEVIRGIIDGNMDVYKLRFLAAHDHWRLGNFKSAQTHFQAALNLKPDAIGSYVDFARFYIAFDRNKKARQLANAGLKKFGNHYQLFNIIASTYYNEKKHSRSLEYVYKSKRAMPNHAESVFLEGINNYAQGKYRKAEMLLTWAGDLNKRNPDVFFYLGQSQRKQGDAAKQQGKEKVATKKYQAALNSYGKALAIAPNHLQASTARNSVQAQ